MQSILNKDLFAYVTDLLNQRRTYYEPQWYADLWGYENNHFIGWNSRANSILMYPTRKKFFIQFPEVKRQVDGAQNLMMASNPVYQVYPTDYADEKQKQDARYQSLFLKQHYLDWHEDNILNSVVHNGFVLPISFVEIAVSKEWDIETSKYIHTTVPRSYDAFDVLFDPRFLFDQQPCIVKFIRTTSDMIAKSPLYKDFKGKQVSSFPQDYKEIYYTDKFGSSYVRDSNRIVIAECHVRDGQDIKVVTIDGQGQVLRETVIKDMPYWTIVPFQPSSGSAYQPSLLENLLPINRSLDLVANRAESMMLKYVKGSYLVHANTQVSMSDEDGTITSWKGSIPPEILKNPDFPQAAWEYINFMQSSSDRYGLNSVTLGGAPKGSNMRSGKMMDKTNANAMLQQKMYMDNFTYMLKRSAEVMVYLESKLLVEPRNVTVQSTNNQYESKQFVGQDYYDQFKANPNVIPLPKSFKKLSITIEDESMHGIEAKRTNVERYAKAYNDVKATSPEILPLLDEVFTVGDMDQLQGERDKNNTLLDSPAFQNILENLRSGALDGTPQIKQIVAQFTAALSQDPNIEKPNAGIPEGVPNPKAVQDQQPQGQPGTPPNGSTPPVAQGPNSPAQQTPNQPPDANKQVPSKGA